MSKKSGKIAAMIESLQGQGLDAHYLGYFDCFNRQLFYEAHDVLEELWLQDRRGPDGNFYKGLIQLAGAFVHLQKSRRGPAQALFRLADANLRQYESPHHQLELSAVHRLISEWLAQAGEVAKLPLPLESSRAPRLSLLTVARD